MNESQYEAYWRRQNAKVTQQWFTTNISICPQQMQNQSVHNDHMAPTHAPNANAGDQKQRKSKKIADILNKRRSPPNHYCSSSSTSFSNELMKSFDKFQVALDSPSPPQSTESVTKQKQIYRKQQPKRRTMEQMGITKSTYLRIIPDQTDKHYLTMIFPVHWFHPKLVPDLLHHFSKHLNSKVSDLYIERIERFGFFTLKDHKIAKRFMEKCQKGLIKCMGRIIDAKIVEQRDEKLNNWIRIRVKTINFTMGSAAFEKWIIMVLGCSKKRHMVRNIQLLIPNKSIHRTRKTREKPLQMMVLFDNEKEAVDAAVKLEKVLFKGYPMNFEYWEHPNAKAEEAKKKKVKAIEQRGMEVYCFGEMMN